MTTKHATKRIILVPVGFGVGLHSVSAGLVHASLQQGIKVAHFKPISQKNDKDKIAYDNVHNAMELRQFEEMIGNGNQEQALENIVAECQRFETNNELIIIEGLIPTKRQPYAERINAELAKALSADIIIVANPDSDSPAMFEDRIEASVQTLGGIKNKRLIGCILNKLNAPMENKYGFLPKITDDVIEADISVWNELSIFSDEFKLLGSIPWSLKLVSPRTKDIIEYLDAEVLNPSDMEERRINGVTFCSRNVEHLLNRLQPGRLIVTPGDRADIILATCLFATSGTHLAGLLLTNDYPPSEVILNKCRQANLPIANVSSDTWDTSCNLMQFDPEGTNDPERLEWTKEHIAEHLTPTWLEDLNITSHAKNLLSPPAFRHQLTMLAKAANKTVVLPEGNEIRTIKAAAICAEKGIAKCQLLGDPAEIKAVAAQHGIELPEGVTIVNPEVIIDQYVAPIVELRKKKGMTELTAVEALQDNIALGTMMLQTGDVDGLVAGAVNTTANTIRPALQLVKTAPGSSLVSSVFFMLMPDQVMVYGDCAINPDPTAEQLAEIAIQSADTATLFGLDPKVAMISYSTGSSGFGADVEKVTFATKLAQEKRPDLVIDGPLQYDAAVMENVASKKAPNSPVAGQANVCIFPDLNTGNTTYKAVQRSADLISIGPMLQGMKKPVNDLSRGALVEDIVYTIALTAIQANVVANSN